MLQQNSLFFPLSGKSKNQIPCFPCAMVTLRSFLRGPWSSPRSLPWYLVPSPFQGLPPARTGVPPSMVGAPLPQKGSGTREGIWDQNMIDQLPFNRVTPLAMTGDPPPPPSHDRGNLPQSGH